MMRGRIVDMHVLHKVKMTDCMDSCAMWEVLNLCSGAVSDLIVAHRVCDIVFNTNGHSRGELLINGHTHRTNYCNPCSMYAPSVNLSDA